MEHPPARRSRAPIGFLSMPLDTRRNSTQNEQHVIRDQPGEENRAVAGLRFCPSCWGGGRTSGCGPFPPTEPRVTFFEGTASYLDSKVWHAAGARLKRWPHPPASAPAAEGGVRVPESRLSVHISTESSFRK